MKVVVCGAGVIGASIAYFLAQKGIPATVVERNEVACAASGKSGGFSAHNCWGMLNAPATGLAVSELLAEGAATSVDISPFSASRKALTSNRGGHV